MIRAGERRVFRVGIALAAVGVMVLAACGSQGSDKGSSSTTSASPSSTTSTTTTTTSTSTSAPSGGVVPGACTKAACPDLDESSGNLMRGVVTTENANGTNVTQFLTDALDDLDESWGQWFSQVQWGDASPGRALIAPGTTFMTRCTDSETGEAEPVPSDEKNAYFCSADAAPNGAGVTRQGSVVLPVQTFVNFWHGQIVGVPAPLGAGEFAAATVVAHEYGHNVVYRIAQQGNIPRSGYPQGDNSELIADCFAGNWAATALRQRLLRPDDLRQAVSLIEVVGDPEPGQGHGTSAERGLAIQRGFGLPGRPGQPIDCLTTYWPEVFGA